MLLDKDADITARDEVSPIHYGVCVNVCVCIFQIYCAFTSSLRGLVC